ncbi:YafY family transcriptional regulator [Halobacillus litoralis]|uniref:helix-turn-helix transcriptional regulator n=1 Tax=Halobacillus litoralis TaxID=45668 RepID=UPI001CD4A795|nr:YafY family protein [Halobacillus litoralis]MCA0970670.1 YafY family transcriptional regulator [Halobacillus litoralis]
MKAERLIRILLFLQHGEKVSTRELAEELEVSERTIHRDMESLSTAGIPVYAERGAAGGWKLIDNWKQKLSWLKEKEVLALFLPQAEKIISDLNMDTSSTDIRDKLLLSIPNGAKESAEKLWSRIHVDMGTWKGGSNESLPALDVLKEAVLNNGIAMILYKKANGDQKNVRIKPLGLVAKSSAWYVVAMNEEDEFRSYKVNRVKECTVTNETFERPADFVLAEHWESSKKQFVKNLPEFQVNVKASRFAQERIHFTGRFVSSQKVKKEAEGWAELALTFNSEEEAVNFIVGFGNQVVVCSPHSLRDKVTGRAREILELYES